MTLRSRAAREPLALVPEALETLRGRASEAVELARQSRRPAAASVTVAVPAELDASAAVLGSRGDGESYFCLEQPERDGFALAGVGEALRVEAAGADRFEHAARAVREHGTMVVGGDPEPLPGAGPVFAGGFSFAPAGGAAPEWEGLAPLQLMLPELSLARHGDEARLTVSVRAEGDETSETLVERARARIAGLHPAGMPLLDPHPARTPRVAGASPPSHYESAVARAVERIRAGELEKVVLAREVRVHAAQPIDPAPVFDALRGAFPACYCYLAGAADAAFVGASPELLVRREGSRAQTVALAGTTRRSADPAVDDHLGEQLLRSPKDREEQSIVAGRIERTLEPVSLWVAAAREPGLARVQNVQHLATAIRAQLTEPLPALALAGLLHPTPAVGGEPREAAEPLIPQLEGLDRGWYAGGVGWTDLAEDGEFCVALRCALLRGRVARLYAGSGIVRDSAPSEELAETEVKLQALLPLLS